MWPYSPDMIISTPFSHITLDILYFVEGERVWKMGAYNVIYKYNLSYVFLTYWMCQQGHIISGRLCEINNLRQELLYINI